MNYKYEMSQSAKKWSLGLIALGFVLIVMHIIFSHDGEHHYARLWANVLLNASWFTGICIAGLFFVAVHNIAMSAWQTVIKRIPEVFFSFLPFTLLLFLMVFFSGMGIYHWSHEGLAEFTEGLEDKYDNIIAQKAVYLNQTGIIFRTLIYFALWFGLAYLIRKNSIDEDMEGGSKWYRKSITLSSIYVVVFAITISMSSWDWLMSLDPHWFSTLYGWYVFTSYFVSAFAVIILFVIYLKRQGYLTYVNDSHMHDLGKYLFAFSMLWMYMWFCQFMLIWYGNIPEETLYFQTRFTNYPLLMGVMLFFNFLCPFLIIMTRDAKRNQYILMFMAAATLFGHWLDMFILIMPSVFESNDHPLHGFSFAEWGVLAMVAGAFIYVVLNQLQKASLVPHNHPYLKESLHHEC
jgi:hypothetical protein